MDDELIHLGLKQKINLVEDFFLFDEVFCCLKGGAYRAAYIINWICIAESIKRKFEIMSNRDAEIGAKVMSKLRTKEENKHQTDRFLLDMAEQYGIIGKEEFLKLEHICTLRGLYAHPVGNSPTKDEVILAIKIGVNAVLSKNIYFRHSYIKNLILSIYEDRHYIENEDKKLSQLAQSTFIHVHPELREYLVKESFKRLEVILFDPAHDHFWYRGALFTNYFINLVYVDDKLSVWDLRSLIKEFPKSSVGVFLDANFIQEIDGSIKDLIIAHALEPVDGQNVGLPSKFAIEHMYTLIQGGSITEENHISKYSEVLSKISYKVKSYYKIPVQLYFPELIVELTSYDWYRQNPVIRNLEVIGEKLKELPDDLQCILGRNISQAAEGKAEDAIEFINHLNCGELEMPNYIIKGLIIECFINDSFKIRYKNRHLEKILMTINLLDETFALEMLDELISYLDERLFKSRWLDGSDNTVRILERTTKKTNFFSEKIMVKLVGLLRIVSIIDSEQDE